MSNDSVRRIMAEVKEFATLNKSPTTFFHAAPLETDLFEWHFTVRGPPDTPFSDGVYHGRIVLPAEYPLKAPEIILLTPNGRFEVGNRICLSVTAHHQETWQPSWGIRTILTALVGFMPSKAEGVGALDYPDDDRRRLARRSWTFHCDRCDVRPVEQLVVPAAVAARFPGAARPPDGAPCPTAEFPKPKDDGAASVAAGAAASARKETAAAATTGVSSPSPSSSAAAASSSSSADASATDGGDGAAGAAAASCNAGASCSRMSECVRSVAVVDGGSKEGEGSGGGESGAQAPFAPDASSVAKRNGDETRADGQTQTNASAGDSGNDAADVTNVTAGSRAAPATVTAPASQGDSAGAPRMSRSVDEPELLYLAYGIAVVILAVIARRIIILTLQ